METAINTAISCIVSLLIGYLIKCLKDYKKKDHAQNEALMILLQSNLTNTYFAYEKLGEIPDYVYKNWLNELKVYEKLGGDDFIHILAEKIKQFKIISTDIL